MCLILDANRFSQALSTPPDPAYVPLVDWLTKADSNGVAVFGGAKLDAEIERVERARDLFRKLVQAGRAKRIRGVDVEEGKLRSQRACVSDDEHIVALARLSGARVVCTEDKALMQDIGNRNLIDHPRGRIYRSAKHGHLLHHDSTCPGSASGRMGVVCGTAPAPARRKRRQGKPRRAGSR